MLVQNMTLYETSKVLRQFALLLLCTYVRTFGVSVGDIAEACFYTHFIYLLLEIIWIDDREYAKQDGT